MKKTLIYAITCLIMIIFLSSGNSQAAGQGVLDGWSYSQKITPEYPSESTSPAYTLVELNYGYYGMRQTGFEPADSINDAKVAVIDGRRFLFINTGWGGGIGVGTPIQVFSADRLYKPISKLGETKLTYSDFYVTTIPQLWDDTIILHGNTGGRDSQAFIGVYNINSNIFEMIDLDTTFGNYLTQVYYIEELNLISLRFLSLYDTALNDMQVTCTPEYIMDPLAWQTIRITGGNMFGMYENMFAYNPSDGFGYLNRWASNFESEVIQYNIFTGEGQQIFYTPPATSAWCGLRNYISTNGSSIFFSSASVDGNPSQYNPGIWRYWEYHNGVLSNFANQPIVGYSHEYEGHGNIISLGNDVLLTSSLRDNRDDGSWFLYQGSTLIETYSGVGCHNTDNLLIKDGDNIVLGGEGKRLARVTLLTPGLCQKVKPDFSDIRFSIDGVTLMDHCLAYLDYGNTAQFIVETSRVESSFIVYFGNPAASSMAAQYDDYKDFDIYKGGIEIGPFGFSTSEPKQNTGFNLRALSVTEGNLTTPEASIPTPTPQITPPSTPVPATPPPTDTTTIEPVEPESESMPLIAIFAGAVSIVFTCSIAVIFRLKKRC